MRVMFRARERRNVFADVHEQARRWANAPDLGFPWTSADMFRRSLNGPFIFFSRFAQIGFGTEPRLARSGRVLHEARA